jgi:hypothetical protein
MATANNANFHRWRFFRAGGVDQVQLRDGKDIANLGSLDQSLWIALAVPTRGTELDAKTADLIDADKDGRIRPPEIIAAVQWAARMPQLQRRPLRSPRRRSRVRSTAAPLAMGR